MATYYISPTGNDTTGNGSSATPWATISKAHTSAASGDTIICKSGTYTWSSQTFTKSLTIRGESVPIYSALTQTWTGAIMNGAGAQVTWANSAALTIQNIIFTNAVNTTLSVFNVNAAITMTRCVLYSINHRGYYEVSPSFFDIHGLSAAFTLSNCIFYNNPTNGGSATTESNGYISIAGGAPTITVSNCSVYDTAHRHFLYLRGNNASLTAAIKNNIFYSTAGIASKIVGVFIDTSPSTGTYIFFNNAYFGWTNNTSDAAPVTANPLFVDPANGDFRLRPGSPAINAGVAL